MPKMPVLKSKEVISILEKNGFVLIRTKGSHAIYDNAISKKMVLFPCARKICQKERLLKF